MQLPAVPLSTLRATLGDATGIPLLRSPPKGEALLRPRARGYAAYKDLQSIIVHAHQLKDPFHRLRGPPSPCAGTAARLAALLFYQRA